MTLRIRQNTDRQNPNRLSPAGTRQLGLGRLCLRQRGCHDLDYASAALHRTNFTPLPGTETVHGGCRLCISGEVLWLFVSFHGRVFI